MMEKNKVMKANELMVGDYVYNHRNWECPIVEIHKNSALVIAKHYGEEEFLLSDLRPIPLTPEILEKNGFKKDAFTNLSPDYYLGNDEYSICVNLNSTCDKSKSIWIEKRSSRFIVSIEESRHSLDKKPLYVHQLQHALRLCGIEKTIEL